MTLAESVVHSGMPCYVPKRGKTGTYPWNVHPETAFWVHIQSMAIRVILKKKMKDDYQVAFQKIIETKEHHRTVEEIIDDIKKQLMYVKEESFLIHAMRLIIELDSRATSSLYTHLQSPIRQTLYLIDVYYSIEIREESDNMSEERWNKIAILLNEIEMTYFVSIGFPNNGGLYHDERDKKTEVSLATFLGYFSNAVLSYEEQTRDRIVRYIKPYDEYIQSCYGFTIDEALKFIIHVRGLINNKLNDIFQPYADIFVLYKTHPEEWRKLTRKFEERGLNDPHDWWNEPELSDLKKAATTNPGEVLVYETKELMNVEIPPNSLQCILDFFSYNKDLLKGKTIYYSDKHHSESHPLVQIGEKCVCPTSKFLFEGLFFRLDEVLMKEEPSGKYKQKKGTAFEKKVREVFQQFFPEKTKIFTNYSVDGVSENDLLIISGNDCIIVEIKSCNFREPFRDPMKAYERIKRDFQKAIQLGYEQCRRVEKIFLANQDVNIYDAENENTSLYRLKKEDIGGVWSIVVTDFKYGVIQTNLSKLLEKDEDALYPWSVSIDDLEVLFLLMKKMLKGIAPARFIEFLDYREKLQEHVLCFDELEICGWYLNDRKQFKEYAGKNMIFATTSDMGAIFDAYYHVGLGFKDELDIGIKKCYKKPDYQKCFEVKCYNE
jgi:hypothetical protein